MSTKCHPKRWHLVVTPFVHEMSPIMSTKCLPPDTIRSNEICIRQEVPVYKLHNGGKSIQNLNSNCWYEHSNGTLGMLQNYCMYWLSAGKKGNEITQFFIKKQKSFVMQFFSPLLPKQILPVGNNFYKASGNKRRIKELANVFSQSFYINIHTRLRMHWDKYSEYYYLLKKDKLLF